MLLSSDNIFDSIYYTIREYVRARGEKPERAIVSYVYATHFHSNCNQIQLENGYRIEGVIIQFLGVDEQEIILVPQTGVYKFEREQNR